MAGGAASDPLTAVLEDAQRLGFIGSAPLEQHRAHASAFVARLGCAPRVLDLGSGGGLPGLVIAAARPDTALVLVDARLARADFLRRAVRRLGWDDRILVLHARAEQLTRQPTWRAALSCVVARGFGSPTVTAECAAGFLAVGGALLVSEPPGGPTSVGATRWPADGLGLLGLAADPSDAEPDPARNAPAVRRFIQVEPCPARYPRRSVRPALW